MSFSYSDKDEKGGAPMAEVVPVATREGGHASDNYNDFELGHGRHKETLRTFKPRHIQMIGIGGAIGTGLFVSAHLP